MSDLAHPAVYLQNIHDSVVHAAEIHLPSHLSEPWGERPSGVQVDDYEVYATIDHIDEVNDGDAVAVGTDGARVKLTEAGLRLQSLEIPYYLACRL